MIDLIVPTIPGREESLARCLVSFRENSSERVNEIVIVNSPSCGEGWIAGLRESDAEYVALVADDLEMTSDTWAGRCMSVADRGWLPCPRVWQPDGGVESQGGDMNALGHLVQRHRKHLAACDFTTVPFMSREQADAIGMIPTQYCCDVWVSYRGRQLGYQTVLVHGYDLTHYQEQVGRGAGMVQSERDAVDRGIMAAALEKAAAVHADV